METVPPSLGKFTSQLGFQVGAPSGNPGQTMELSCEAQVKFLADVYDHDGSSATACILCPAGNVTDRLAGQGGRTCTGCPAGYYAAGGAASTAAGTGLRSRRKQGQQIQLSVRDPDDTTAEQVLAALADYLEALPAFEPAPEVTVTTTLQS